MRTLTHSVIFCAVLAGCAAPQPSARVYDGPERPLREVASIRGSNLCEADGTVVGETRIIEVNGIQAASFDKGYQRDLLVTPGISKLKVFWFYAGLHIKEPALLEIEAKPGHRYIVRARTDYKKTVQLAVEDKGPHSGEVEFVHPVRSDGKPSNCY